MNFDLSEDQALFRAAVERFVLPVDTEFRRRLRSAGDGYDRARWRELADLGLLALAVSEDAGGMGGTPIDLALVAEALGKGNAPDPWLENGVLPARILALSGKEDVLASVLSGQSIAAFALAERAMRYDLAASAMTARRAGDGYVLSGEKTFVLGGAMADWLIVSADLDGETALFLLAADTPGLERRAYRIADGSTACELRCLNVAADKGSRLPLGMDDLRAVADDVRLLAAAEMAGLAQRLFDDTLAYVKQREQFGAALGTFQALQHRLVECYAALEQARSMLYRAALADRSDPAAWHRSCAGAKAFIGEQADRVAREAVQMHGGMGVTDELAIGHALKRVLLLSRLLGDADSALAEFADVSGDVGLRGRTI